MASLTLLAGGKYEAYYSSSFAKTDQRHFGKQLTEACHLFFTSLCFQSPSPF